MTNGTPTSNTAAPQERRWTLRWVKGLIDGGLGGARSHQRLLSLSRTRASLVVVACALVTVCLVALSATGMYRFLTRQASAFALSSVHAVLDNVRDELRAVASDPTLQGALTDCTAEVSEALVRHSLRSELLTQFMVLSPDRQRLCGPLGDLPVVTDLREKTQGEILLYTRQTIEPQLVAALQMSDGRVIKADVDRRAFTAQLMDPKLLQEVPDLDQVLASIALQVLTPSGQPLAALVGGEAGLLGATVPWLRHLRGSDRYGLQVAADVNYSALVKSVSTGLPAWMLVGLLLGAAMVLGLWRSVISRARLVHRLAGALRKRQFEPWVQPIVEMHSGQCVGGEVLMRWQHPHRGVVTPGEFIEEAERSGLINEMSDLVMGLAAYRLGDLARRYPQLYFSVNVTPGQLARGDFAQRLAEVFSADSLPAVHVLIELTERDIVDARASHALGSLRDAGWRIALDDFGTGQSSLALLEQLRIDRIKIDQSFVRTIDGQTVRRPVLDAIIGLAAQLEVPLIAEGVETRAQWDYLNQRGVTYAQGYLLARPMPIDAFARWLDNQQAESRPSALVDAALRSTLEDGVTDQQAAELCHAMREPARRGASASDGAAGGAEGRAFGGGSNAAAGEVTHEGAKFQGGLDVRDRRWRLRLYPKCFVGREAVDWIVQRERVSRAKAVRIGRRLVALGLMAHVAAEHDFEDADLFYVFTDATGAQMQQQNDLQREAAQSLRALARGEGVSGLHLRTHVRGIAVHRECFTGAELAHWLGERWGLTTEHAALVGAQLMRQGVLRHVFDDRPFAVGRDLYRP
jgi:sensor c-di-GMP phosphodiesterase-like protein